MVAAIVKFVLKTKKLTEEQHKLEEVEESGEERESSKSK